MQEKVYRTRSRDSEGPCEGIVNVWEEFDRLVIRAAIGQWRARLEACAETEDGHFEHTL